MKGNPQLAGGSLTSSRRGRIPEGVRPRRFFLHIRSECIGGGPLAFEFEGEWVTSF